MSKTTKKPNTRSTLDDLANASATLNAARSASRRAELDLKRARANASKATAGELAAVAAYKSARRAVEEAFAEHA